MKLCVEVDYPIGAIVYLKTDPDQLPRIVFAYEISQNQDVLYKLAQERTVSLHYNFELQAEKNYI